MDKEATKLVAVDPRTAAIVLELAPKYEFLRGELQRRIEQEFSFRSINTELQAELEAYVARFLEEHASGPGGSCNEAGTD